MQATCKAKIPDPPSLLLLAATQHRPPTIGRQSGRRFGFAPNSAPVLIDSRHDPMHAAQCELLRFHPAVTVTNRSSSYRRMPAVIRRQ